MLRSATAATKTNVAYSYPVDEFGRSREPYASSLEPDCEGFNNGDFNIFIVLVAWFSRAGKCIPLELEYLDPAVNSMNREEVASMNGLVQRYQARWRCLSLFINPKCFCDAFFDLPPSSWNNLHTLTICAYDFVLLVTSEERAAQGYDALEEIPSLRCIVVEDHADYEFTRRFGPLDLVKLHINFDVFRIDHARLIAAYSSLTKLTLHLFLLNPFTTLALVELDIQLSDVPNLYEDAALHAFLGRCISTLRTFTLNSHGNGEFVARVLPVLSSLTHLTFDIWPEDFHPPTSRDQDWSHSLRDLTFSIISSDAIELERMANLAVFLRGREELGLVPLESLTILRSSGAVALPYKLFNDLEIGKFRVIVPLQIASNLINDVLQ
ncbi:hypothetical protein BKA70DRAFT_1462100 [Coprinopsis sp. MPI-PUGE-AT-0042]|nr:hypothetical protein BKA70DRAFT_1462100 [Coprinopsis sp. MPI-PUGE-AT-0042]